MNSPSGVQSRRFEPHETRKIFIDTNHFKKWSFFHLTPFFHAGQGMTPFRAMTSTISTTHVWIILGAVALRFPDKSSW
jgi:hypothetical protein